MREYQNAFNPQAYAVLARAQLALAVPTAAITATLDEYEALLKRTEFHVYEGELRACLAEREREQKGTEGLQIDQWSKIIPSVLFSSIAGKETLSSALLRRENRREAS